VILQKEPSGPVCCYLENKKEKCEVKLTSRASAKYKCLDIHHHNTVNPTQIQVIQLMGRTNQKKTNNRTNLAEH
jgi:hypothetical protein